MIDNKKYCKQRIKKLKSLGLCIRCKKPTKSKSSRCKTCSLKASIDQSKSKRSIRLYKKRVDAKLCIYCGKNKPIKNIKFCEKCRIKKKRFNNSLRKIVLSGYGNKCSCCGELEKLFLQIDHINNDGTNSRKKRGAGYSFHKWIIKNNFPKNLQILCANCNWGRRLNNGICPHSKILRVNN